MRFLPGVGAIAIATVVSSGIAFTGLTAVGAADRSRFVGDDGRFTIALPNGCHEVAATSDVPRFIACGKSYARSAFFPGGTDRAALQRAVNTYTGGLSNAKLIENMPTGSLGGVTPARTIVATGTYDKQDIELTIVGVPRDGGWYVLDFAGPRVTFESDARSYFEPLRANYLIADAARTVDVPKLRVVVREGSGVALVAHVQDSSTRDAMNAIIAATTRYLGTPPSYAAVVLNGDGSVALTRFRGKLHGVAIEGSVGAQRENDDVLGLVVYDNADRFEKSATRLMRAASALPSSKLR
jgi:hypothetical protein